MIYTVIEKASGQEVYRYTSDAPVEWTGMEFDTFEHVAHAEANNEAVVTTKFGGRRTLAKLEFRSLFPEASLKAIDRFEAQFEQSSLLTEAQKDDIRTAFNNYNAANEVHLDDPRWIPGLGLYVALGMLSAEEMAEVLRG